MSKIAPTPTPTSVRVCSVNNVIGDQVNFGGVASGSKATVDIIISRYNESLSWLSDIKFNKRIFVYNKGLSIELPEHIKKIALQNIGREGHTFLFHIINNFYDLADYNIFYQGNPLDHFINAIKYANSDFYVSQKIDFRWLGDWLVYCDRAGMPLHDLNLNICEFLANNEINYPPELNISFGAGGQFIVSKDTIHKKSIDFYKRLLSTFNDKNYPEEYKENDILCKRTDKFFHTACIFERIWQILFVY
jgi:hypothetical protein